MASNNASTVAGQFNLDLDFRNRELAAQIAIANAQQAYNEKHMQLIELGALTQQADQLAKQYALSIANFAFQQEMARLQFGLTAQGQAFQQALDTRKQAFDEQWKQAELSGFLNGAPTLDRERLMEQARQFDVGQILNAPHGPADAISYANRLRGLNSQGLLPAAVQSLFNNQQIAGYSNGGQATPTPLSSVDLATQMTAWRPYQATPPTGTGSFVPPPLPQPMSPGQFQFGPPVVPNQANPTQAFGGQAPAPGTPGATFSGGDATRTTMPVSGDPAAGANIQVPGFRWNGYAFEPDTAAAAPSSAGLDTALGFNDSPSQPGGQAFNAGSMSPMPFTGSFQYQPQAASGSQGLSSQGLSSQDVMQSLFGAAAGNAPSAGAATGGTPQLNGNFIYRPIPSSQFGSAGGSPQAWAAELRRQAQLKLNAVSANPAAYNDYQKQRLTWDGQYLMKYADEVERMAAYGQRNGTWLMPVPETAFGYSGTSAHDADWGRVIQDNGTWTDALAGDASGGHPNLYANTFGTLTTGGGTGGGSGPGATYGQQPTSWTNEQQGLGATSRLGQMWTAAGGGSSTGTGRQSEGGGSNGLSGDSGLYPSGFPTYQGGGGSPASTAASGGQSMFDAGTAYGGANAAKSGQSAAQSMFGNMLSSPTPTNVPYGYGVSLQQYGKLSPSEQQLAGNAAEEFAGGTGQYLNDWLAGMDRAAPNFAPSATARYAGVR